MMLLPEEEERLLVFLAAELARRRRSRGLKLSHPEAVAIISDEVMEGARDGKSFDEVLSLASSVLTADDVLPGVPQMLDVLHIEALFDEGTLMVTVHWPLGDPTPPSSDVEPDITLNARHDHIEMRVTNSLDRAVQVTSHYHFFEVTRGLRFDRSQAYGRRLDIPAGTSIRFEPGDTTTVRLIPIGGRRVVYGHAGLTNGALDDPQTRERAFDTMHRLGYLAPGDTP